MLAYLMRILRARAYTQQATEIIRFRLLLMAFKQMTAWGIFSVIGRSVGHASIVGVCSILILQGSLAEDLNPANGPQYNFDVPQQNLGAALQIVALVTTHKLLYRSEIVNGIVSPPLKANLSLKEALDVLLAGTDLTYEISPAAVVVIKKKGMAMKFRSFVLGSSIAAVGAVGVGTAGTTLAQGIEEVIVTAQKREESAQDIPIAIDVITGDTFIQEGIRDIKDMGKTSTELEINSNTGQATRIGIRGMQQGGFAPTGDTLAAVHIDGIFLTNFWALNGLMFDLDRVEVLAGPQGTLYGRNSAAGAINMITRRPGKEFAADGNVEFGNFNTQRYNAGVNLPVTDSLAFRIAGTKFERDALFTDGGGAVDQSGGRLSAVWDMTDRDTLVFTYDYVKTAGTSDASGLIGVNSSVQTYNPATNTFSPTTPASVTNALPLLANDEYDNKPYETLRGQVFGGDLESTHWGVMANYTHGFDTFDFVLQASHRDLEGIGRTATRAANAPFVQSWPQVATTDVAEMRLVSDDQGSVVWVGGLFYFSTEILHGNAVPNGLTPGSQPTTPFFPSVTLANGRVVSTLGQYPDPATGLAVPGCPCTNGFYPVNGTTDAWAAYGQMTWTPDSLQDWHFTAGLRYSYDEKEAGQGYFVNGTLLSLFVNGSVPSYLAPYVIAANEARIGGPNQVLATDLHTDAKDNWDAIQWRLGVEYDLSDSSMLYGSLATGYKSGGYAFGVTPKLEPETLLAFEIGSKNRLADNTVQLNVSAWFYDYKDLEQGIARPLTPPFPVVNNSPVVAIGSVGNVGEAYLGGLSVDLDWAATDRDRIGLAATYIYSDVVDGTEVLNGVTNQVLNEGERLGDAPEPLRRERSARRVRRRAAAPPSSATPPGRLPAASSASASAHPSEAAFAVPAAMCGRSANAASPIRQVRPNAIRGTSISNTACTNGSSTPSTTAASGGARWDVANARISATWTGSTVPGGSVVSRRTPSRSVINRSSAAPG